MSPFPVQENTVPNPGDSSVTEVARCRIASDHDLLSRVQLDDVASQLKKRAHKLAVEKLTSPANLSPNGNKKIPGTAVRLARLMDALLKGECDALVLSAPSLPSRLPTGLTIGAITSRLTPYDVLLSSEERILDELPENATMAANEVRREAQLLYYRPDLKMVRTGPDIESIIEMVDTGKLDAAVLCASDVERLNKQDHVTEFLTCSICVPAAGQGSLAVLVRSSDDIVKRYLHGINDAASYSEIVAEWACLHHLGLNETAPVGVLGSIEGSKLELEGVVASPDGREKIRSVVKGSVGHEEQLGKDLADEILEAGGKELLRELNLI